MRQVTSSSPRVLVADPELATRLLLVGMLTREGFEADQSGFVSEARFKIQNQRYDGIFMEALFSEDDGTRLIVDARASQWNGHTPIVVVTGARDSGIQERVFAAGASFLLHKPVDVEILRRLIQSTRGAMLRERRRSRRIRIELPVTCFWDPRMSQTAQSIDLSVDGISLQLQGPGEGATVRLGFLADDKGKPFEAAGVVARCHAGSCGIRFTWVAAGGRERIGLLVEEIIAREARV